MALAGAWWVFAPQTGTWPLVVALMPWGIRLAAGKFPVRRTALDIPLLIFLLTAGIGVWAAYDQAAAWNKFWLMTAGVLLYYALAGQPKNNWQIVSGSAGVLGAGIGLYFLLTHDWAQFPADLDLLNRLGQVWMSLRPTLKGPWVHPNIAGGLLAMLLPVSLAVLVDAWQRHNRRVYLATAGLSGVMAIGLVMTSSRAAWLALAVGLVVLCWWHVSGLAVRQSPRSRIPAFGVPLLLIGLLALGALGTRSGSLLHAAGAIPGEASTGSRVEVIGDTLQLIRDYPFTGSGLASFPGQYSTYIRVIFVPVFFYSHNLYTDVALEQGLIGLAAFLVILTGAGWMLIKNLAVKPAQSYLAAAGLVSLVAIIVHGLVDDALYGMGGTPLIFVIAGIAASLRIPSAEERGATKDGRNTSPKVTTATRGWMLGGALALLILGGTGLVFSKPLTAAWNANLGAVAMARIQVGERPATFDKIRALQPKIEPLLAPLHQALAQNPHNTTALYRLGMQAYYGNNFEKAQFYLLTAHTLNPGHRGIQKLLGYTYTWTGEALKAESILTNIPEAGEEMDAYTWWWGSQNQASLANLASQMADQLRQR